MKLAPYGTLGTAKDGAMKDSFKDNGRPMLKIYEIGHWCGTIYVWPSELSTIS